MTDNIARNTTLRYGVPQDRSIKDKKSIEQYSEDGTITEYTTPWVGRLSSDGLITPNSGWWAFDVDLSLYSGKGLSQGDNIHLQMRSWEKSHVSLSSLIAAKIDGTIEANVDLLQSQHLSNSMMGMVSKVGSMGGSLYKVVTSLETGKWGEALSAGINIGKTAANLCGVKTEAAQDIQGKIDGTVTLSMTGSIETSGSIEASKQTTGIVSPTFYLKDFDFSNAPALGEGIWNLETSPVVYYTDAYVDWRSEEYHTTKKWTRPVLSDKVGAFWDGMKYVGKKSPFGGVNASKEPCRGRVCYFDPTSVKVTLNPHVFTEDEIRNAKVYAVCGVRHNAKFGSTEGYRTAMDLGSSELSAAGTRNFTNRPFDEVPFDALSSYNDKMGKKTGVKFDAEDFNNGKYGVFGRGDKDYLLEPVALHAADAADWMPAYEVNVTLVVEHEGTPIVYSRTFLPKYEQMNSARMTDLTPEKIADSRPDNYVAEIYSEQMNHIKDLRNWIWRTIHPAYGSPYKVHQWNWSINLDNGRWYEIPAIEDKVEESFSQIFDGDPATKWCCRIKTRNASEAKSVGDSNRSVWFAEFQTNAVVSPVSYTLVTANDNSVFSARRPRTWALYGRESVNDAWKLLDKQETAAAGGVPTANALPHTNMTAKEYQLNPASASNMHYFRFEVLNTWDNDENSYMQLGEFRLNW